MKIGLDLVASSTRKDIEDAERSYKADLGLSQYHALCHPYSNSFRRDHLSS